MWCGCHHVGTTAHDAILLETGKPLRVVGVALEIADLDDPQNLLVGEIVFAHRAVALRFGALGQPPQEIPRNLFDGEPCSI